MLRELSSIANRLGSTILAAPALNIAHIALARFYFYRVPDPIIVSFRKQSAPLYEVTVDLYDLYSTKYGYLLFYSSRGLQKLVEPRGWVLEKLAGATRLNQLPVRHDKHKIKLFYPQQQMRYNEYCSTRKGIKQLVHDLGVALLIHAADDLEKVKINDEVLHYLPARRLIQHIDTGLP